MCGIAGIVCLRANAESPTKEALIRMASAERHRGPDEFGVYRDNLAGFAHARLSIIDLATGQQPLANEDETLWVVFNGEIFNYVELRAELIALGHSFRTHSDTEVIVHAYEAWGDAAFARFNGQFAIALWETREHKLVLARDRLGVRPLHYTEHMGRVVFASEVKSIFAADSSIPRAFDAVGLDETFTFWSIVPPQSVFAGVNEVRPGHVRTYVRGLVDEKPFWEARYPIGAENRFNGTLDDAVDATRDALTRATELRMLRADVPVGSYLSGGLDSSLVATLGLRAKGAKFSTFSMRFVEDGEYDETGYQHLLAKRLGTDHHEVAITKNDIAHAFRDTIVHTERPVLRTAPAPLYLLSKLVHESGIKVVLTGEGADEMFAGYDIFREAKVRRFWAKHPESKLRPLLLDRLYPYLARSPVAQRAMAQKFFGRGIDQPNDPVFAHRPRWQSTGALRRLFTESQRAQSGNVDVVERFIASLPNEFSRWSPLAQDQFVEVRTLLAGYLLSSQGDRVLMANSVEGRFPFLDANVATLANSLPASYKLKVLDEKHVLKRVGKGLIPDEILARTKQPYRAPDALAFTGTTIPEWMDEMMSVGTAKNVGVFDPNAVASLWKKCRSRTNDAQFSNADNMAICGVLSTHILHTDLIAKTPDAPPVPLTTLVERA